MPDLVGDVMRWIETAPEGATRDLAVPGAETPELRRLAALGGLAHSLGGEHVGDWPVAVREWALGASMPPADLVRRVRDALVESPDPLAAAYERAISGRSRRSLGTFFTPKPVVNFMLETAWAAKAAPAVVIDAGAGVGAFTLAAAQRWKKAHVVAVDVNPVTLGLLACRLAPPANRVSLVHADFLVWSQSEASRISGPRLWLGNPPYTRHQSMASEIRTSISLLATNLVPSGLAGLSAYFLASILQVMRPDDALCLLLPGNWTDARYGRELRTRLASMKLRTVGLYAFPTTTQLFPGTRVNAMVLYVGPEATDEQPFGAASVELINEQARATGLTPHPRDAGREGFGPWLWKRSEPLIENPVRLHSVARVRRGVATGGNRFFLLTDEQAAGLPTAYLRPALRSLRDIDSTVLDQVHHDGIGLAGRPRWLVQIPPGTDLDGDPGLKAWRDRSKSAVEGTYLGTHREAWYAVERIDAPDILLGPMGKGRLKVVRNLVGAIPSNAVYGLYLKHYDPAVADRLSAWFNSSDGQAALRAKARAYGAGLFKLEPKDAGLVQLPGAIAGSDAQPNLGLLDQRAPHPDV